jgi:hypothetical protein
LSNVLVSGREYFGMPTDQLETGVYAAHEIGPESGLPFFIPGISFPHLGLGAGTEDYR